MTTNSDNLLTVMTSRPGMVNTLPDIAQALQNSTRAASLKATEREMMQHGLLYPALIGEDLIDEHLRPAKQSVVHSMINTNKRKRRLSIFAQIIEWEKRKFLVYNDARGGRRWIYCPKCNQEEIYNAIDTIIEAEGDHIVIFPSGILVLHIREILNDRSIPKEF